MNFPILDIVFIVITVACVLISTIKGFAKCVLSKVAFVVSILLAVTFTPNVEKLLKRWVDIKYLTTVLSFLAAFIIAFLLLKIVQLLIEKIFQGRVFGALDKIFGSLWGLLIGFVLSVAIVFLLMLIPVDAVTELVGKSYFAKFILPFFAEFDASKETENTAFLMKNFGVFNV